jgi:hypothetical protein
VSLLYIMQRVVAPLFISSRRKVADEAEIR